MVLKVRLHTITVVVVDGRSVLFHAIFEGQEAHDALMPTITTTSTPLRGWVAFFGSILFVVEVCGCYLSHSCSLISIG